jgi:parallel beta-helix repeat protein
MEKIRLFIILLFCAQLSFGATQVAGCREIDTEGEYELSSNIAGANVTPPHVLTQACIVISNSSVVLDCVGYNVSNDVTGQTVSGNVTGILLDSSNDTELTNVTVKNCFVSNYTWGITAYLSNDSVIQNNSVRYSENIAIELLNSTRINLTDNIAYSNPGAGFSLNESFNNTFTNNTARNNTWGFTLVEDSSTNTFTSNTAYNNTWHGFIVQDLSHDNIFVNNTAYNNTEGFYIYNASYTTLINNTAYNNSETGFLVHNDATYNVLTNNTAYKNIWDGFCVHSSSDYTNLTDNIAYNNSVGFLVYNSSYNNLVNNTGHNNSYDGFQLSLAENNTLENNTAYGNEDFGFVLDEESDSNTLTNNTAYNNSWTGIYLYSSNDNTLVDNTANNNSEYGFEVYLSTGNNITNNIAQENQIFDLYADPLSWYYFYAEPAYDIYCNNIIENLTGSGDRPINYTNTSVDWDGIEASEIVLCNADNSNLTNVKIRGSDSIPNNGLIMTRTDYATIDSSNSSENIVGFFVLYSNNNSFTNNIAQQDLAGGFYIFFSLDNNLTNNIQSGGLEGGFVILVSNNTQLTNNNASSNEYFGIFIEESSDVSLTNNTVYTSLIGMGIEDSNRTVITGDHYYGNDVDFQVSNAEVTYLEDEFLIPPPTVLNLSGVIFDNPAGDFVNYTNLSINDLVENNTGYFITWSTQPAPLPSYETSVGDKYLNIMNNTPDVSIDEIIWHWTDEEAAAYNESRFAIYRSRDSIGWLSISGQSRDTSANTISISDLAQFSVFTLIEKSASSNLPSGGGGCIQNLKILVKETICPDNRITVEITDSDNNPVGADQLVVLTDPDGKIYVEHTSREGEVTFTMPRSGGYKVTSTGAFCGEYSFDYQMCTAAPSCKSDDDCGDAQYCEPSSGACKPVGCPCGQIYDHSCHPYACCVDVDCHGNYTCTNHECKAIVIAQPECNVDSNCSDDKYCSNGKCTSVQLGTCGYVSNHSWKSYECCNNSDCQSGYLCTNHSCMLYRIITDSSGVIGTQHEVRVIPEGKYQLRLVDPQGNVKTIDTNGTGYATFVLENTGLYSISLIKDEAAAANVTVNALGKVTAEEKPASQLDLCLLGVAIAVLLLVAIIYVIYRRSSRR